MDNFLFAKSILGCSRLRKGAKVFNRPDCELAIYPMRAHGIATLVLKSRRRASKPCDEFTPSHP
jgi:hypothetical protein